MSAVVVTAELHRHTRPFGIRVQHDRAGLAGAVVRHRHAQWRHAALRGLPRAGGDADPVRAGAVLRGVRAALRPRAPAQHHRPDRAAVTAAVAFVGLRGIAAGMAAESGGGHSHGEETASETETAKTDDGHTQDSHTEDAGTTAPESSPSAESTGTGAGEQEGGHAEDGHAH